MQCIYLLTGSMWLLQSLPAWNVLLLAREPVAISIVDCAKNDIVMAASGAKVTNPHRFA